MGDNETKKKTAKTTDTEAVNAKKTKDAKTTKADTHADKDLKLPTVRRIHVKPPHIILACIILVLALFFTRVAIWEHNYLAAMEGSERDNPNSQTTSTTEEETDNTEPTTTEVQEYIVAPDKPRYLTIRSLGIYNSRIVEVGLTNGDEMATPRNIYDSGWYINSALPGANGVSIINAHGGDLGNGIFRNLPKISVGAEIVIEMGDGRKFTYVVHDATSQEIGDAANDYMTTAFSSPKPGVASMTLITCTGDWLETQQTYSRRLFVRALLK